ncbi:2-hydroxyacyl-CoA lyase 1 [Geodia barretti]|uniref:2-hydroxyacyl-CoA lyase 1 n=1 Tax=Geodia barretti TaxID=519541 RepID=A0AA35QR71_GEOBA|nr:2-hydroxyacyl-CoA lyase 1 [Geodia barretti]
MGAFQEWPQLEDCSRCKYAVRLETLESIPFHVEKAVRSSLYGRPGPSYIEIPGNMTSDAVPITRIEQVLPCPPPPMSLADPAAVQRAVSLLRSAQRPLVIVGKGVAYAFAEHEARSLIVPRRLPFLPTPMGKGVLSDAHPLCVSPARSRALQEADVILLLGARLNWILHFGLPPRFSRDVKIIQVEICPEEFSNNVPAHLMLHGHLKPVLKQLVEEFGQWVMDRDGQWWSRLKEKIHINMNINKARCRFIWDHGARLWLRHCGSSDRAEETRRTEVTGGGDTRRQCIWLLRNGARNCLKVSAPNSVCSDEQQRYISRCGL